MNTSSSIVHNKPIALQIEEFLLERIRLGYYPPGQRMPSEERLAEELGVSRASVRTAMASLAAKGYIQRRHGDGTYVLMSALQLRLRRVRTWDIERQILESGRQPSWKVIEEAQRPPSPVEAERLALTPGEQVLAISRLVCADERPVGLIRTVIRVTDLKLPLPAGVASLSPVQFLEQAVRPLLSDGEIHFLALLADEDLASMLECPLHQPLLRLEGLVHDSSGRAVIYETETYLGQQGFRMNLSFD